MKILIVSKVPTHPTNAGNRWGILAQAQRLMSLGNDVHFLYVYEEPLRKDKSLHRRALEETSAFWGNKFHVFVVNKWNKIIINLRQSYRTRFCDGFMKCDDEYPCGLTKFVEKLQKKHAFDACIVNYYLLTKLFEKCHFPKNAIFTHDCFTYRALVADNATVQLTPNEESKAMQRSPYIFAVQDEERNYFQFLSPKSKVFNIYSTYCYHSTNYVGNKNIVFLSSDNEYNINGIIWFVNDIFPSINEKFPDVKLIIGGAICRKLSQYDDHPNINLLGYVSNPIDLYSKGDVAINPVYQGTGLKIKTFEAISYGKVTIVHPHSMAGVFDKKNAPLFASDHPHEWIDFLLRIWGNEEAVLKWKERDETYLSKMNDFIENEYKEFLAD